MNQSRKAFKDIHRRSAVAMASCFAFGAGKLITRSRPSPASSSIAINLDGCGPLVGWYVVSASQFFFHVVGKPTSPPFVWYLRPSHRVAVRGCLFNLRGHRIVCWPAKVPGR